MAVTKGAKKAHRVSLRKQVFNMRRKSEMRSMLKTIGKHVQAGNIKEAQALMPTAYKAIDKAAKRGVIKPNTAARKKSRLVGTLKRATAK